MEELKELGKSLYQLANMLIVLSFINVYLQKESLDIFIIISFVYGIGFIYFMGYLFIKRSSNEQS